MLNNLSRHKNILIAVGCIIFLYTGIVIGRDSNQPEKPHVLREGGFQYINPILLCNPNIDEVTTPDNVLTSKLRGYANSAAEKDIAVYYLSLSDYTWAGININESFSPASMLKVPTMVAILRYAEIHPEILTKEIYYDGSFDDNKAEYFKPIQSIKPRNSYTVDQLVSYMIEYSDNNATRLLNAVPFNKKDITNVYTDLGIEPPTTLGDFMSPKTYSLFLRLLYNSTYLNREISEKGLKLMAAPDFPRGLQSGVPTPIEVAQKFGERQFFTSDGKLKVRELHDCGIVYASSGPYALCVMTRGNDFEKLASEIRDISKLVYETVSKN